jgi:hypothetical protein
LQSIYKQTNEGIVYANIIINNGVHRYPAEFLKGGAHGYLDGIGSLSHSSYHYLDVIAWYLQCSPGSIAKIGLTLPYVARVRDYLARQGYAQMLQLNNENFSVVAPDVNLPSRVLNAELDFTLHLHLYDKYDKNIGLINYTSNHTTFSPRTSKYDSKVLDHANEANGGRMSQIYFDIHQGSVQNWTLSKNDIVFEGNNIETVQRVHSKIGKSYSKIVYSDAYDKQTITLEDLFVSFVQKSIGLEIPAIHDTHLQFLRSQKLTHRLFSAAYELIAQDFVNPGKQSEILIDIKKIL